MGDRDMGDRDMGDRDMGDWDMSLGNRFKWDMGVIFE